MVEARLDLHTHTSHSVDCERLNLPHGTVVTIPFSPTLAPCDAYELALARGMTHVTFTDHDTITGCLEVLERHPRPERLVVGEELTCYDRGHCLHVGIYGLTAADHDAFHAGAERSDRESRCLRWNIDEVLAYCDAHGLACDLKHPLWSHSGALPDREVLVSWLRRFPLSEGLNGTRHRRLNELGAQLSRHFGQRGRGQTGGSDSHTNNIGAAYTRTVGATPAEVVASLRAGVAEPVGEHGSHRRLDGDFRLCFLSNANGRAGHFVSLADDYMHNMPLAVQDLVDLTVSACIGTAVVNEFTRQRTLARCAEVAFADVLGLEGS